MRWKIKLAAVILLAFVGWMVRPKTSTTTGEETITAEKGMIVESVSGTGTVSGSNIKVVTTVASGVISEILVSEGQQVIIGAPLVKIELDTQGVQSRNNAWANYVGAKNSLESSRNNLYTLQAAMFAANQKLINDAVARTLKTDDPTYIQENASWLAAENAYKNQKNVIVQANTQLASAWTSYQLASGTIYSPISGTVFGLRAVKGQVVDGTSTKVANIKTDGGLKIFLSLTEADLLKVRLGDKATITADSIANKTFTGTIESIDLMGEVSAGVTDYPAIIGLDTNGEGLYPNMTVAANIITNSRAGVIVVPTAAIITANGQKVVRVLKNKTVNQVVIETGISDGTQTEIISGLDEGDVVVIGTNSGKSTSGQSQSPFSSFGRTIPGGNVRFAR